MSPGSPPASSRSSAVSLGLLTAAALALRLVQLTRFEFFVDEAATWWFARLAASGRIAEQMALEPTPPLYYTLVGGVMRLFGESDFVMRLPSAVFGAATVPAVYFLGRRLFNARVGWIAAVILAIHPLHVMYSREARVYPLLLLLAILLLLALHRALGSAGWRRWLEVGGVLAVACYSHFYGLFLLAFAGLAVLLLGRGARERWRGVAAVAAAGLLFAPYLLLTLPHLQGSGAAWSIESFYTDFPEERSLGRVLEQQLVGADRHPYLRQLDRPPTPPWVRWPAVAAQLGLLAAAVASGLGGGDRRRRALLLLLLGWLVPILLPWGVTHTFRAIFHSGRHDFYTLGAVAVLLAAGLDALIADRRRSRRWAAVACAGAMVLGAGFRLYHLHRIPAPEPHRRAGAFLAHAAGHGDRVIAFGIRRLVTEHYARLAGSAVPFRSFPADTDRHPGWSDVRALLDRQEALHREARERVAELGRTTPPDASLFLLLRDYEHTDGAVSATWLVDRHLLENLWVAGWRATTPPAAEAAGIAVYRPPGSPASRGNDRGHPGEYLRPEELP